jgi:hypothetical protein
MRHAPRSVKWLLIAVVLGAVAVPTAVAAWPRSAGCSSDARFVHLGEEGQVDDSWSVCVPHGFRVSRFQVPHHCMTSIGAWFSNFPFENAQRKRPAAGLPVDGIAMRFNLDSNVSEAGPDSPLPVELADFRSASPGESGAATRLVASFVRAEHLYHVRIWVGSQVSAADQRVVVSMLSTLQFIPGKQPKNGLSPVEAHGP